MTSHKKIYFGFCIYYTRWLGYESKRNHKQKNYQSNNIGCQIKAQAVFDWTGLPAWRTSSGLTT